MISIIKYLATIGRKGGLAKSPAKSAAAKANGKKGGRPKKAKAKRYSVVNLDVIGQAMEATRLTTNSYKLVSRRVRWNIARANEQEVRINGRMAGWKTVLGMWKHRTG